MRVATVLMLCVLTIGSLICCVATWQELGRFIFLPGGDVGLGFYSHHGWLSWIEYAPWDKKNMHYPWWSIPWGFVIAAELLITVGFVWLTRKRNGHDQRLQSTGDGRDAQ